MANPTIAIIGVNQILSTIKTNSFLNGRPFTWFRCAATNCALCIIIISFHTFFISYCGIDVNALKDNFYD